ncbi:MAG: Hsp20/alpha crystallin family protein [Anaerolineae bacterium]
MTHIVRWNPFREIVDMQRQLDRVFDEMNSSLGDSKWSETGNWLALDVHENADNYIVETDLPGINPDDINITLHDNMLTISTETQREDVQEGERRIVTERRYGRFQRSIRLPETVDPEQVDASYDNGVLKLTLAKSEVSKPRQIKVNDARMLTTEN